MQWARGKYSTVISSAIIGFIAFVFVVSGVFSPKSTRGLHEGAVAGTVNGEPISIADFNRALNQRMEFFKNMGGGRMTDEQLKRFHIRDGVFNDLVRRKVMEQEATKQGLEASDAEVMERIREIPAFQKDGKFDVGAYKATLEANSYTPGNFERMVRTDLSAQAWQNYFQSRVKVSEIELKKQYEISEDKRNVKYVLLTTESGRAGMKVEQADVDKFLADSGKLNIAKGQYEAKKGAEYKGKTFDMVKAQIAREILSSEQISSIKMINEKLADKVLGLMTADKSGDAKIDSLLDPYQLKVQSTGLIAADAKAIPGIGDAPEFNKDVFGPSSPIDAKSGGKPKKYSSGDWILIALVTDTHKPDFSKYDADRPALLRQIASKKQREMYDDWLKKVQAKAKVDINPQVVEEDEKS